MREQFRQPFAALHAPVAPYSWEVVATLPRTVEQTEVIPVQFNRPVTVVGLHGEVIANSSAGGGLVAPLVDHVAVELNLNGEKMFTHQRGGSDITTARAGSSFVALGSLLVTTPRLLHLPLEADAPDLHFRFKWKRFTEGAPIYEDALITLTMFCLFEERGQ